MATAAKYIGKPMKRKEDPRLIQGLAHYVDDIRLADMLHMAVLRSPYAHAKIRSVDASKAKSAPNVVAVLTGEDLAGKIGPIPCAAVIPDMKAAMRLPLATDKVRFVGEPIAVIAGTDKYSARDALDLIEVDYDSLPAVTDPEKAIAKGAPKIYENFDDNIGYRWELEGGDIINATLK